MSFLGRWRNRLFTRVHLTIVVLLGLTYLSVNQYFAGRAKWIHAPLGNRSQRGDSQYGALFRRIGLRPVDSHTGHVLRAGVANLTRASSLDERANLA